MKIKVCGLKEIANIKQIDACSIDYMGLIFYEKSPRYVEQTLPFYSSHMKRVGVFVNSSKAEIMEKREQFHLDCIQLHGNESPDFCREIKENHCIVIKAFQIHKEFNFTDLKMYEKVCDYFLFDTKSDQYGGSGKKFDWNILQQYKGQLPFFLSGGIRPEDVDQIKNIKHKKLHALDLNSGFEKQIGIKDAEQIKEFCSKLKMEKQEKYSVDENGYYGEFGGAFIPELLRNNIEELQANYLRIIQSEQFQKEYQDLLDNYVGRPTPLTKAKHLSEKYGANIYLKREDLNHTGAHKINNTIGQILLARQMGKKRIIAETGAGQHGVATATVCALFDMECVVYMGALDVARQAPNVARMEMLGAKVMPAKSGNQTLKDAVNEALRDWIAHPDSFYLIGSVVGPHPYPDMVTRLQAVISKEIRQQLKEETGNENPDYVIACVGGGSNAAGAFYHYLQEEEVQLIAVEASGKGIDTDETAATITLGNEGFLHGSKTLLMQDQHGQITEPYSISAGLDYPGVGPLHAHLAKSGRVDFIHANDEEALQAAFLLSKKEGIIPALESSHALAALEKISLKEEDVVVLNLSGRGDKDMETYMRYLDL